MSRNASPTNANAARRWRPAPRPPRPLVAKPPALPAGAQDFVVAILANPGNEVSRLARKWLAEAHAGPDATLTEYDYWRAVRAAAWATRVHCAYALAIARNEVRIRDTWRRWDDDDAAWIQRLVDETGYRTSDWEEDRLAAIAEEATTARPDQAATAANASTADSEYTLMYSGIDEAWFLLRGADPLADNITLTAEQVDQACTWAAEVVADDCGQTPAHWQARDRDSAGSIEYVAESLPGQPILIHVY